MLRAVLADSRHLLVVVLSQLLQLLTLVDFNAVEHRVNLPRLRLRPIISIAQRTTIHADQLDDSETNENLPDDLKDEREQEKAERRYCAGYQAFDFDVVEENGIDEKSGKRKDFFY